MSRCSHKQTTKAANLGYGLGLVGLIRLVSRNTLSLDPLCLRIVLLVRAEEIDIVVVLLSLDCRGDSRCTT